MHWMGRVRWFAAGRTVVLAFVAVAVDPACAATADEEFATVSRRYIDEFGRYSPISATKLGDHRYDGELDDMSTEGRARTDAWVRDLQALLAKIDRAQLSRENQVDAAMLDNQLRYTLWSDEKFRNWAWDPLVYTTLSGDAIYSLLSREYAPLGQRLDAVASRLEKLPRLLEQTRENLEAARVPSVHAETAVKQNPGLTSLIDELVVPNLGTLPVPERARLERAIASTRAAVESHQKWLVNELVPRSKGDFRVGTELYDEELSFALMSPLSRTEIRGRAETALVETRAEMYEIARRVLAGRESAPEMPASPAPEQQQSAIKAALELAYADRPARDQVVPAAKRALEEVTAFVRRKNLVAMPDAPLDIILMPAYQRGVAVAYCDPPGPLDRGQRTYYAISPIPDEWTQEQVDSFLREYNERSIAEVTIHEAVPGHYLQIAHSQQHPSVLRSLLWSGPFVEGWAVYSEAMMQQAAFRANDPLMRLISLKWYLRAAANAIIDSGIHVDGMSRDEAMKLMTQTAFQEEREAAGKWVRAQLTSAQLSTYFVGYQEHADLRRAVEARAGSNFNLRTYHDEVLSHGSPPVRFVRELMLGEPIR